MMFSYLISLKSNFYCALWYYSAITVLNQTLTVAENTSDGELDKLEARSISCFRKANKSNYAAGLWKGSTYSLYNIAKSCSLAIYYRLLIPDLRQNLVNRGTYKNITDEFMTRDYISWFKKTKPTLQMETLPQKRLHEGYFSQFIISFVLKFYFERLQFTKLFVAKKFKIPNFIVIITLEMTMTIGFSWDQFEPKFFMKILGLFNFMMLSMIMKSSISKKYQEILWIDQWSKIKVLVQKPVKGRFF